MELYHHQQDIVDKIRQAIMQGHRSVLVQSPVGSGKTVLFGHLTASANAKFKRVVILVHRQELLEQASGVLMDFGVPHGLIKAGQQYQQDRRIHVGSVQTVVRRLEKLPVPDLLIYDESHHISAKSWATIHELWSPQAICIGLTATPVRMDGKGLKTYFSTMIHGPKIDWLTERGFLAPYQVFSHECDLEGVSKRAGDFAKNDLEKKLRSGTILGDFVEEYLKLGQGRPGVCFCPTIKMSLELADRLCDAGVRAMHVDGETNDFARSKYLRMFRRGELDILTNVDLFGEGLNVPGIQVIGMIRPTLSPGLFMQQLGRGLRVEENKERALILDHAGNFIRHGFPEEWPDWVLADGRKADDEPGEIVEKVKLCAGCFATLKLPVRKCPYCGTVGVRKERRVAMTKGELKELKRKEKLEKEKTTALRRAERRQSLKKIQSFEEAVEYGKRMGYKSDWAGHYWAAREKYLKEQKK